MKKTYSTNYSCLACGRTMPGGNILHHVKTRGSGGSDCTHNLMPLCLEHHNEVHTKGLNDFANKYGRVYSWLKDNDWVFYELNWKWIWFPQEGFKCSCTVDGIKK